MSNLVEHNKLVALTIDPVTELEMVPREEVCKEKVAALNGFGSEASLMRFNMKK